MKTIYLLLRRPLGALWVQLFSVTIARERKRLLNKFTDTIGMHLPSVVVCLLWLGTDFCPKTKKSNKQFFSQGFYSVEC